MASSSIQRGRGGVARPPLRWDVWRAWTLANAIGEAIGLGATLLLGVLVFTRWAVAIGPIGSAALAVALGAGIEGLVVGSAQWAVLHQPLAGLTWRTWAAATAIGAGIAWALGMVPSTVMGLGDAQAGGTSTPPQAMSDLAVYVLAALLGFVAGATLAVAQWRVLRRFVPHAGWWIMANACAWAPAMVLVFAGVNLVSASGGMLATVALVLLIVALAGVVVGATHGLALIWLLRERDR